MVTKKIALEMQKEKSKKNFRSLSADNSVFSAQRHYLFEHRYFEKGGTTMFEIDEDFLQAARTVEEKLERLQDIIDRMQSEE